MTRRCIVHDARRRNAAHCATCSCADDPPAGPAQSSPGIRRAALEQTRAAIRKAKDSRSSGGKGD